MSIKRGIKRGMRKSTWWVLYELGKAKGRRGLISIKMYEESMPLPDHQNDSAKQAHTLFVLAGWNPKS